MPTYSVPGVYIEEQTGPGVITGVGTSTAAFIGAALRGPMNEPRRISSFDEFLALYADPQTDGSLFPYITEPRNFYLAHAIRGFYENGGSLAYIVRVGTGKRARRQINNVGGEAAFTIEAQKEGDDGNNIKTRTELSSRPGIVRAEANIVNVVGGTNVEVSDASPFRTGDMVTDNTVRARITNIEGKVLTLDAALATPTAPKLRIANITPAQTTFRVSNAAAFRADEAALISGEDAGAIGTVVTERVVIETADPATNVVTLKAAPARTKTYSLLETAARAPTLASARPVVVGSATVRTVSPDGKTVEVDNATPFRVGDFVTENNTSRAKVTQIQGNVLTLNSPLPDLINGDALRIANVTPTQTTLRVSDLTGLIPGGVVRIEGLDPTAPGTNPATPNLAIIQNIDRTNQILILRATPSRANSYRMDVAQESSPTLTPWEFSLTVTPAPQVGATTVPVTFTNLSLESAHPNYIFNPTVSRLIADSGLVQINKPPQPPIAVTFPNRLVLAATGNLTAGADDQPSNVNFTHYQVGLDLLRDVDEVNLVCIPDAAADPGREVIQTAMINHCLSMKDRFAILDSAPDIPPSGPNSVETQREGLESEHGFAALYYPWLKAVEPITPGSFPPPVPRTMLLPPSGHMAGVYARTDQERGVHKAPANTAVRGVLGLERVLSDGQHGPLNDPGNINVLRIFPGSGQVIVWGARTTANKADTDWRYINVRRLLLFLEESIEESLKFSAVFEPNNLALWEKLKRILNEFLNRVWRDGALFGAKAEDAYRVRIDEALNPASTRALGRLYIEISVAAVRPAEFIIVRIGLSRDGASEVSEG